MPSLRKRTLKNYSTLAEGLDDLSDPGAEGSGSNPAAQEDDSFSSGGSEEFRPEPASPLNTKEDHASSGDNANEDEPTNSHDERPIKRLPTKKSAAVKGKGKARAIEDQDEDEQKPKVKGKAKAKAKAEFQANVPRNRGTKTVPAQFAHIPLEYFNILNQSTVTILKPDEERREAEAAEAERKRGKDRDSRKDELPLDSLVPFSTRLTGDPQQGSRRPGVGWVHEPPTGAYALKVGQKSTSRKLGKKALEQRLKDASFGVPWELWRGEKWWPEMYVGKGDRSAKRDDWLLRDQVQLGLDNLGRKRRSSMVFLSPEHAQPYIPHPLNSKGESHIEILAGPHPNQFPVRFSMYDSFSISQTNPAVPRRGYTFFTGGPIWGIDWCPMPTTNPPESQDNTQYLAISTLPHISVQPRMFDRCSREEKGCVQIWSLVPPHENKRADGDVEMTVAEEESKDEGSMKCKMVLCLQGGCGMQVKWMPLGAYDHFDLSTTGQDVDIPKLGILAVLQLDGSISFYAVPHPKFLQPFTSASPEPIYLQLHEPLLRFTMPDSACTCFDWLSGTSIAVGLDNGHVVTWDFLDALLSGSSTDLIPSTYNALAESSIRSLSVSHSPSHPSQLNSDAWLIVVGAWDGSASLLDLRDLSVVTTQRERVPCMATAFSDWIPAPIVGDMEFNIVALRILTHRRGKGVVLGGQEGQIWDMSVSDYHTMLASAAADGTVICVNTMEGYRRTGGARSLTLHKLYHLDYSPLTSQYRLTDTFVPLNVPNEGFGQRSREKDFRANKTAAWAPEVGVHRVSWCNAGGIGRAGWLGSGGAAGVGRVEWVEGRWRGGKVPEEVQVGGEEVGDEGRLASSTTATAKTRVSPNARVKPQRNLKPKPKGKGKGKKREETDEEEDEDEDEMDWVEDDD